jgi:formiminoglutamate deiminase
LAAGLDPDLLRDLARAAFAEMSLAGITCVGEFHYLHHGPDGTRYADPAENARALAAAADDAGVRLTLLDTCYLSAGWGEPVVGVQRRFADAGVDEWAERSAATAEAVSGPLLRVAAAVHSVRAVEPAQAGEVARISRDRGTVLHVHLSEQPAENEGCQDRYGASPTRVLADAGVWDPAATAVHATHLQPCDVTTLGGAGVAVCLCPTTERDLADGVGPAGALVAAGATLCLGSDSQAVVDLFEEARAVELDERLLSGRRGVHPPPALLTAATANGARALGWPEAGTLRPGSLADLTTLSLGSVRLAGVGSDPDLLAAAAVFSATAADVTDVQVAGRPVVSAGVHRLGDVSALLHQAITAAWAAGWADS